MAVLASAVVERTCAGARAIDVYRAVVATYVKTGDPAAAVKPLLGWDRKALDAAVADTIATADAGPDRSRGRPSSRDWRGDRGPFDG